MSYNIQEYIKSTNKIYEEIRAIKSADCIMDYDTKTEIIDMKKRAIAELDSMTSTLLASGIPLSFDTVEKK